MSDNEEDGREGSGDGERTGEDRSQPRDPETGQFLPSGAASPNDAAPRERIPEDADGRDRGAERDGGEDGVRRTGLRPRVRRGSIGRARSGEGDRRRGESNGGTRRRGGTKRRGGTNETHDRGDRQRSHGRVTFGQGPIEPGPPTPPEGVDVPITTYLRRPEPSTAHEDRRSIVPQEVLQTSAEREYPPWLAKSSRRRDEPTRGDDERESWEAPVDHPRADPRDAQRRAAGERRRVQPERQATRRSPDRPRESPRTQDGQPRTRPGDDRRGRTAGPDDRADRQLEFARSVIPGLASRHMIGRWVASDPASLQSELPPYLQSTATYGGSSGPREGARRYVEPHEVTAERGTDEDNEVWEYTESNAELPSERWETPRGGASAEPDGDTSRDATTARSLPGREDDRGGETTPAGGPGDRDDRLGRPDLFGIL